LQSERILLNIEPQYLNAWDKKTIMAAISIVPMKSSREKKKEKKR
jgi:hypothetical protein